VLERIHALSTKPRREKILEVRTVRVHTLYSDGTASEVILELRAPDRGGDPAKATVVGAEDAAVRTSAERAVKAVYSLLIRRGYDPAQLRYSASFNLDPPSRTPASGDSAGLAFLIKFLTAVIEKESGEKHENLVVAATGVISESSADARVGRVDGILEKVLAADDALPPGTSVFLPQENLDGLRDSGELGTLDSQLKARLKGIANIGEVLAWADSVMPLESHLPTWTRIGCVDPSAAKSTAAPSTTQPARRTVPGGSSVQPSAAALSRSGAPPARGTPLWLKRLILYSSSFCVGPLLLLAAFLSHGGAARQTEPGKTPVATPAVTPAPTPRVVPTPAPIASPQPTPALEAPRLMAGYVDFETSPGLVRPYGNLKDLEKPLDLGDIQSNWQIKFCDIRFSSKAYFYLFSSSREPFLGYLFPGAGTDEAGNPVKNPLAADKNYNFPSAKESHRIGPLPLGIESLRETIHVVLSSRDRSDLVNLCSEFGGTKAAETAQRNNILQSFLQEMGNPPGDTRVITIHFNHVPPPVP
jgi:hypothetical protein